ncbi:MAG TPA: helix-turn-helix domain-containing protein [Baekduia sp.]|uniref:TetR/AcrR family transcriptional regulator n=1 Tax=Baekduia sp. TaxID=2600305 RepID=UPI002D791DD8|nr:helix-turn-helix domain-containing protein [Baekduia sp.]HET6505445.1 helix-turn-helix domain-containing protein [Baekduia sp.]
MPATEIRCRVENAMAALTAEKGYAAVTIDDLARAARISKRTFYDHYAGKEDCLLAAYESAAGRVLDAARRAADAAAARGEGATARVEAVISTYLKALAAQPEMTRVFHVEIQAAGAEALRRHLAVDLRYVALLQRIVREDGGTLSRAGAIAALGAVHELVLHAVAEGRTARLPSLLATVRPILHAVLPAARGAGTRSRASN